MIRTGAVGVTAAGAVVVVVVAVWVVVVRAAWPAYDAVGTATERAAAAAAVTASRGRERIDMATFRRTFAVSTRVPNVRLVRNAES